MKICKRKYLTMEERIKAIDRHEGGESIRAIAKSLGTGRMQIALLIRKKEDIRRQWEAGVCASRKLLHERKVAYPELDEKLYEWFLSARSRNVPTSGRLLQKKAIELAKSLGIEGFCASNGWLDKFQKRKNITGVSVGESRDLAPESVSDNWKGRLSSLCEGYAAKDIFTCAETCLFYGCTPGSSIGQTEDVNKNPGKESEKRLTVLFCCSMEGEKLPPFVIGRFKILYKPLDRIEYQHNLRAWMSKGLFEEWLNNWNTRLVAEQRNIILLLDHCAAHPYVDLSNIKMIFLPPNAKSTLQPLDAGIIQLVRQQYHSRLLSRLFQSASGAPLDSNISSKVHVLDALSWLSDAWEDIETSIIVSCFSRCGLGDDIGHCELNQCITGAQICGDLSSFLTLPTGVVASTDVSVADGHDDTQVTTEEKDTPNTIPHSKTSPDIGQFSVKMEDLITVPAAIHQVERIRIMAFSHYPQLVPVVNDLLCALESVRDEDESRQVDTQ
ncbi:hypothetical protein CRM22_001632 [Opisthorchis felineus]|uniref:HTH CENPB-type domain-containing protein n=1 Tax=Opisthorchis felineus TaxID=147828 RepID=A0A4S2MG59_OPIFE|nr:hypothetical protein CRM22_001632 [Opisthorchis felineus]